MDNVKQHRGRPLRLAAPTKARRRRRLLGCSGTPPLPPPRERIVSVAHAEMFKDSVPTSQVHARRQPTAADAARSTHAPPASADASRDSVAARLPPSTDARLNGLHRLQTREPQRGVSSGRFANPRQSGICPASRRGPPANSLTSAAALPTSARPPHDSAGRTAPWRPRLACRRRAGRETTHPCPPATCTTHARRATRRHSRARALEANCPGAHRGRGAAHRVFGSPSPTPHPRRLAPRATRAAASS